MKQEKKQNDRIRVAVLMGGPSAEHEISLKTGRQVLDNLDRKKYVARGIKISKTGKWPVSPAKIKKEFDVAFVAMHGEYGEDGQAQKLLDKHGIKYTGSGARASALGMDKAKSAKIFRKAGLRVPEFVLLTDNFNFTFRLRFPVVVKPNDRGSSVGVSIVERFHDLVHALRLASRFSPLVMVQEFIPGREVTCGILEIDGKPAALPPTEIIPRSSKFFDYSAKYLAGASSEITPPKLPKQMIKKIQETALKAHKAIGARGFSRTDMILGKDGKIYVLEINTIPGLTETSLLPQEAKAAGIGFSQLLDGIIASALW